jgi:hypothetical protein
VVATGTESTITAQPIVLRSSRENGKDQEPTAKDVDMSITKQIEILMCKARHPSCSAEQRLEIRHKIYNLQLQREEEYLRDHLDNNPQNE